MPWFSSQILLKIFTNLRSLTNHSLIITKIFFFFLSFPIFHFAFWVSLALAKSSYTLIFYVILIIIIDIFWVFECTYMPFLRFGPFRCIILIIVVVKLGVSYIASAHLTLTLLTFVGVSGWCEYRITIKLLHFIR